MKPTYRIMRHFFKGESEFIMGGLSLEEAQAYCRNPETSALSCTLPENIKITEERGRWFDGYEEE